MLDRPLRVEYAIEDDLQCFAKNWLAGPILVHASALREADGTQVATLHRDGRWQVELCCVRGQVEIPEHTHPEVDTIEVTVCGAIRLTVNGIDPFDWVPDGRLPGFVRARGIRINAVDRHGGKVLPGGVMFLSIQRWRLTPSSVLTNYRGLPLGNEHQGMITW